MSEWTHGFVIFLNLITLGFVIGEAIRGPSNILAPSGHPPRFSYTWRPLIGGSHAIRGRLKSAAPRPRHSRPIPVPPQNGAPPPSITHATRLVTISQAYTSLLPAGNSVSTKKRKLKIERGKKKKRKGNSKPSSPKIAAAAYPP